MLVTALLLSIATGCDDGGGDDREVDAGYDPTPTYTEEREPCADRDPLRNLYFGDLHVHTGYSFDAWAFDVHTDARDAYRFAQGEPLMLPPLDAGGEGTRSYRLDRPLDFAAVTDHAEYLGAVQLCGDPESPAYDSETCVGLRERGAGVFAVRLSSPHLGRFDEVCGEDGEACRGPAIDVWDRVQRAAEEAYDRTSACGFTSFVAYEYTNTKSGNALHRNVIFRNARVLDRPISAFDEPQPDDMWRRLRRECIEAETGCDVLAIPHNPNQSAGTMFEPLDADGDELEAQRAEAELRASLEPVVEIYQHKGASECIAGIGGVLGAEDELCSFEQVRQPPFDDCGDGTGFGGALSTSCVSRRDYVRYALAVGMRERGRLGVNPFQLGIVAGTDTHSGIPGATEERDWPGHVGDQDAEPADRVAPTEVGNASLPHRILGSPGGLTAVWAVEGSRDAIFEALRRRETFGTSGTRMSVRLFAGWDYPAELCDSGDFVATGYDRGVPMGGELPPPPKAADAPTLALLAMRDPGTSEHAGTPLQRIQVVKGTLGPEGQPEIEVFDVAGDAENGATVDPLTCERSGEGADTLCAVWTDPSFDPDRDAFYYARVLENPSCRWSTRVCNALPAEERPEACDDPERPKTVQERAWTSPVWYEPTD